MEKNNSTIKMVVKSCIFSVFLSLFLVMIFALILKSVYLSTGVVKAINQFIKVVSIGLGVLLFIRGNRGLIKGVGSGITTIIFTHLIFLCFGTGHFDLSFWVDQIFGLIVGGIFGILSVNLREK